MLALHDITASGATRDNNYAFEYEAGDLTVGKATLTVSANNKSREYGEANPTFDGDISGFKNSETASVIDSGSASYSSTASTSSNVGNYMITASGTYSDNNYAFEYEAGDLTVGKATLTVSANDKSREYGEANPTFDGDISGFKNDETASVVSGLSYSSTATAQSDVGSYDITASGATATNYAFTYVNGDLEIAQKVLTFSKPTVADKTYDGSDSVTFDESEISFFTPVKGDTIDYKLSGEFTSSTVGKAIPVNVVVQLLGESALNYSLTQANFQLFADIKSALPKSLYKELAQASAPAASPETVVQAAPQVAMRKPVSQVRSGRSTGRGANRIPQLAPSLSNSQLTIEQVQAPEENTSVAAVDESTETESKLEIQNSMNLAIEETLVVELGLGQLFDVPLSGNEANVSSESNDLLPNAL